MWKFCGNILFYVGISHAKHQSSMFSIMLWPSISSFPLEQNGRNFTDDSLKRIFVNENARISIKISLKFGPSGLIDNKPALIGAMAWRQTRYLGKSWML